MKGEFEIWHATMDRKSPLQTSNEHLYPGILQTAYSASAFAIYPALSSTHVQDSKITTRRYICENW